MKYLSIIISLLAFPSVAATHYCSGKVTEIVTRASTEGTQISLENMNGVPHLNFGGSGYENMHERQFAMLLAAYMSNQTVVLEFISENGVNSCSDNHNGHPIRYVRFP